MSVENIRQLRLAETGLKSNKDLLQYYSSPENDMRLTDDDAAVIEYLWWKVNQPWEKGHRYYRLVDSEPGSDRQRTAPISVVEEGYWYCPVRLTQQEVMGDNHEPYCEIYSIQIAKTAAEAIEEAKRIASVAARSWVRNLLKTEVLLSGKLKFPGQTEPRWLPVQLRTDGYRKAFDQSIRQWMEDNGYKIIE